VRLTLDSLRNAQNLPPNAGPWRYRAHGSRILPAASSFFITNDDLGELFLIALVRPKVLHQ
jgi:hypothetical protein